METSITLTEIRQLFQTKANLTIAADKKGYMRNQFEFFGLQNPPRKEILSIIIPKLSWKQIDWKLIDQLWKQPERELQYFAVDLLKHYVKLLKVSDLPKLKKLIETKSWWDTVDSLQKTVEYITSQNFDETKEIMLDWSKNENMWVRRSAIIHQLLRKQKLKEELLTEILLNNFGSKEFFINKAIGWALRDYSKTNPEYVRNFLKFYEKELDNVSIREAKKYI